MHIAGIMGTPTVSIFSKKPAHDEKKWHPIKNKHIIITPEAPYDPRSESSYMRTVDLEKVVGSILEIVKID